MSELLETLPTELDNPHHLHGYICTGCLGFQKKICDEI